MESSSRWNYPETFIFFCTKATWMDGQKEVFYELSQLQPMAVFLQCGWQWIGNGTATEKTVIRKFYDFAMEHLP